MDMMLFDPSSRYFRHHLLLRIPTGKPSDGPAASSDPSARGCVVTVVRPSVRHQSCTRFRMPNDVGRILVGRPMTARSNSAIRILDQFIFN